VLTNKVYADGKGTAYSYTPDGKPATRVWARGVETAYSYDAAGSLTNIAYSGNTQPVSFTLDRLGLQKIITDATGIRVFTFNDAMQLAAETNAFAALNRTYDELGRSDGYQVTAGDASVQNVAYAYSDMGRFSSLSSAVPLASNLWSYTYLANAGLISGWSNGIIETVKSFEANRDLITQIRHAADETLISQFDYENDALGRRTRRLDAGSAVATNLFGYDARNQLIYATLKDNEFAWVFDAIGNRVGDTSNSVTHCYSVNALNQYEQITNGGVRNLAYDLDGNLTNDSVFAYVWDGENRLIGVNGGGVVAVHKYDYMSRRAEKTVNGVTNRFIYDGWNLVAETSTAGVTNFYVWGADLSGSLQGAGGIGGLLAVIRNGETYYPVADANGNITDYLDANGSNVAHRAFDAFGKTLVAAGPMANDFNFWFSSKYLDHETGLYYYGYRYYAPEQGRWLSRDPVEETGGIHLYMMIRNNSVNWVDYLGMWTRDGILKIICCNRDRWVIDQMSQIKIVVMRFKTATDFWLILSNNTIQQTDLSNSLNGNTFINSKTGNTEIRLNDKLSDEQAATTLFHESEHTRVNNLSYLDEEVEVRVRSEQFGIFHGMPETKKGYRKKVKNAHGQEVEEPDEVFIKNDVYGSSHYNPQGKRRTKRTYDGTVGGGTIEPGLWDCRKFMKGGTP
jgi:RHS repeat-associated protein